MRTMSDKAFCYSCPAAMSETRRMATRMRLTGFIRIILSVVLLLLSASGMASAASCCHADCLVAPGASYAADTSSPLASLQHKEHCAGCLDLGITGEAETSDDVPFRKILGGYDTVAGITSSGAQLPEAASSRRYVPSGSKPGHRFRATHRLLSASALLSPASVLSTVTSWTRFLSCRNSGSSTPWGCARPCEYYVFALREIIL